jgi:hypothetical protein
MFQGPQRIRGPWWIFNASLCSIAAAKIWKKMWKCGKYKKKTSQWPLLFLGYVKWWLEKNKKTYIYIYTIGSSSNHWWFIFNYLWFYLTPSHWRKMMINFSGTQTTMNFLWISYDFSICFPWFFLTSQLPNRPPWQRLSHIGGLYGLQQWGRCLLRTGFMGLPWFCWEKPPGIYGGFLQVPNRWMV